MKCGICDVVALVFVAAVAWGQGIRTAGELFVDLDADSVTGIVEDDYVTSWVNNGTLSDFVPAVSGKGATYVSNLDGSPALAFDGTTDSTMAQSGHINNATAGGVPDSILGTNIWSAEVWVYNPSGSPSIETLLAWTSRRNGGDLRLMEMRYYNASDAVEHYARNLLWGGQAPAFGQWHHIACVRNSNLFNRVYVDGRLVYERDMGGANMLNLKKADALFSIGSVDTSSGWNYSLSGYIAVARVHDGALSSEDVRHNFTVERSRFGYAWQNAGVGSWENGANWENGSAPLPGASIYLSGGGTATYTGAPYVDNTAEMVLFAENGTLNIAGGSLTALPFIMHDSAVRLGAEPGGAFTLKLSGGTFITGSRSLILANAADATGAVALESNARLIVSGIQQGLGSASFIADGGTLEATLSTASFMRGLDSAIVKGGGLAIDVPEDVAISVAQALLADAGSPGGGLIKNGAGALILSGANTLTGAIAVNGGQLHFQSDALPVAFSSSIALSNGADVAWNKVGGAAKLTECFTHDSVGTLTLYSANAADDINLSAHSNVTLRAQGTFTYTGTLTPFANLYRFAPDNGTVSFQQQIADLPEAPGRVEVRGTSSGTLNLSGDNSYTGGTLLESGNILISHTNALGSGALGARDIHCSSGTALNVRIALNDREFFNRVAAEPDVSLLLEDAGLDNDIVLTNCPNLFTGVKITSERSFFNGVLTPYCDTYLLGNSGIDPHDGAHGFVITNLTDNPDGTPRSVLIRGTGAVNTRNNADYSGGTRIEDGGKIIVTGDRGFGKAPEEFDSENIVINNGGVLRTEHRFVTLAPTRGITFGPGTTRIHASGALPAEFFIPGDISGTGSLRLTDMGWVVFAGTNNTYNGNVMIDNHWDSGAAMMIGDGDAFSWSSTGGIVGLGTHSQLYLNNSGDDVFNDTFSGKGTLSKKGAGIITLATAHSHKHTPLNTIVESGTLRYGVREALPSGPGYGIVDLGANGSLDVNGFAVTLNNLSGGGVVTNSLETAVDVTVGGANIDANFSGCFAAPLSLVKSGDSMLTLTHENPVRQPVVVNGGTLALEVGLALTNGLTVGDGALVLVRGCQGLRGEYYDNVFPASSDVSWPDLGTTVEAVDNLLEEYRPSLIAGGESFGEFFDSGINGEFFPGKYSGEISYFVTRWTGEFTAESDGLYYFNIFADDGCMLFLDGELVVNNRSGSGWKNGSVNLTRGEHDIMLFFYEKGGIQAVQIYMTPPNGSNTLLPQSLLRASSTKIADVNGLSGSRLELTDYGKLEIMQSIDSSVGGFSGTNAVSAVIEKHGAGILTLSENSTFGGATRIRAGGITIANGISHNGAFDVRDGTLTLSGGADIDDSPVQIGSLNVAAAGGLVLEDATALRINQSANGAFSGMLTGGTTDSLIAKDGAAELVVATDLSAYPGSWSVFGGDLVIDLELGGAIAQNKEIETRAGGAIVFRSHTNFVFSGAISGSGAVRNEGPGILTLSGAISCGVQVAMGQTIIIDGEAVSEAVELSGTSFNAGTLVFNTPGTFRLNTPVSGAGEVRVGVNTSLRVNQGGVIDSQSLLLAGGTLLLNNGSTRSFDNSEWVTAGVSRFVDDGSGNTILELNPNEQNTRGAAYYYERVQSLAPWIIDLTFHAGVEGNMGGDGFGVFFQNDSRGTSALPRGWYNTVSDYSPCFGFQYYLMPDKCYLTWVDNGALIGKVENNLFAQRKGEFTARMTFDGTRIVVDMQQETTTYSMTNFNAAALLEAVGSNAWMGVVGGTGGAYGQQFIDTMSFGYTADEMGAFTNDIVLATGTTSTIESLLSCDAVLPLRVGNLTFSDASELVAAPAVNTDPNTAFLSFGDLTILGDCALSIDPSAKALLSGNKWSFKAGSVLNLTGSAALPPTIHLVIDGDIPAGRMNLVDCHEAEIGNPEEVDFVIDGDDGKTKVFYRNGWFYTSRTQGVLLILR